MKVISALSHSSPLWLTELTDEDLTFIKNFVLSSGSLKAMAGEYAVSYPTIRLRLNRVIERIRTLESSQDDAYVALIKQIALEGGMTVESARTLITAYRAERGSQ